MLQIEIVRKACEREREREGRRGEKVGGGWREGGEGEGGGRGKRKRDEYLMNEGPVLQHTQQRWGR